MGGRSSKSHRFSDTLILDTTERTIEDISQEEDECIAFEEAAPAILINGGVVLAPAFEGKRDSLLLRYDDEQGEVSIITRID